VRNNSDVMAVKPGKGGIPAGPDDAGGTDDTVDRAGAGATGIEGAPLMLRPVTLSDDNPAVGTGDMAGNTLGSFAYFVSPNDPCIPPAGSLTQAIFKDLSAIAVEVVVPSATAVATGDASRFPVLPDTAWYVALLARSCVADIGIKARSFC
jgi:hypothetical protein